ncbi:hypothetical protein H0H93_002135, partial [Arthromyces matolae]
TRRLSQTIHDSQPKSSPLASSHPPGSSNPSGYIDISSSDISGSTTHDLSHPYGAKHGPKTVDASSSGGATHQPSSPSAVSNPPSTPPSPSDSAQTHRLPATIHDSQPKSPRIESSHASGSSNPSIDPSSPISGPTTHDAAHDTYENLLLKAVGFQKKALDMKVTSPTKAKILENLMIQSFQLRAEAIKAKARMEKK